MYKMEKSCAYFFVNQTPMISKSKYALKGHSKEVLMHYKKSMRIFWLSLCLLIAAGIIILAAIQYQSHKRLLEGSYENNTDDGASVHTAQSDKTPKEESTDATASFAIQSHTQQESSADVQTNDAKQHTAEYRFELKVKNGYLDVYHFHTEDLFFHTGVPYSAMTVKQRQELENGKYFINEQELYGYLESCTS